MRHQAWVGLVQRGSDSTAKKPNSARKRYQEKNDQRIQCAIAITRVDVEIGRAVFAAM